MGNKIVRLLGMTAIAGAGVGGYFFKYAFVRHKVDDAIIIDDNNHPCNANSKPFLDRIVRGQDYIDKKPYVWVKTNSKDGLKLQARFYPAGCYTYDDDKALDRIEISKKTIILFHGYRSTARRDFSCAVELYNKLGLNVLLVDQRSHGRSEGKLITFGVLERLDVVTWIDYVTENYPDHEIVLGGLSMGSATVLMASELLTKDVVKCIISDCGYSSPKAIMCKVCKEVFHTKGEPWFKALNVVCKRSGFDLTSSSAEEAVKNTDIPILFFHGTADSFVPVEMGYTNYEACASEKELCIVEGAEHGFSFLVDEPRCTKMITDFINKYTS